MGALMLCTPFQFCPAYPPWLFFATERHQQHNIRRKLKMIEHRAGPFIEGSPTAMALEDAITQLGQFCGLVCLSGLAVWAIHPAVRSLFFAQEYLDFSCLSTRVLI